MKQIQTEQLNLIVMRDNHVDMELTHVETAPTALHVIRDGMATFIANAKLEVRMFAYDALFKTNYRTIHSQLVREQHNRDFEASIGISRIEQKGKK